MKHSNIGVWLILGFTAMLWIIWGAHTVQARSLSEIRKTKEIRVCIAPIYPSYAVVENPDCREDCKMIGPIPRMVEAFVKTLDGDITIKFLHVAWDEQFFDSSGETIRDASYTPELLASGTCDVYPTHLTKKAWRVKKLDFVILFSSRMMVIINKEQTSKFTSPADLAGKVAAVEKDTSYHTWLQEQNMGVYADNPITIRLMGTEEALQMVETNEVDFTLIDADMALWATAHHLKHSMVAFPVGETDELGWAFRKEDKELQAAVQKFFDVHMANETSLLNKIWKEEFGVTLIQLKSLIRATR